MYSKFIFGLAETKIKRINDKTGHDGFSSTYKKAFKYSRHLANALQDIQTQHIKLSFKYTHINFQS